MTERPTNNERILNFQVPNIEQARVTCSSGRSSSAAATTSGHGPDLLSALLDQVFNALAGQLGDDLGDLKKSILLLFLLHGLP